jgi:hypothetical protein
MHFVHTVNFCILYLSYNKEHFWASLQNCERRVLASSRLSVLTQQQQLVSQWTDFN